MALNLQLSPVEVEDRTEVFNPESGDDGVNILDMETVGEGDATEEGGESDQEEGEAESESETETDLDDDDDGEGANELDPDEIFAPQVDDDDVVSDTNQDEVGEPLNILDEIALAEEVCKSKEAIVNNLKEMLKDAKTDFDAAVNNLRKIASSAANDRDRPLFKSAEPVATFLDGQADDDCDSSAATPTIDWRSVSILELTNSNLSPAIAQRLKDSLVDTIGQLEDLRADISNGKASWPKGIGAAKITAIEEAVTTWLSTYRDQIGASESVPVSPPIAEAESGEEGERVIVDVLPPDAAKFWKGWREWDEEKHAKKFIQWAGFIGVGSLHCLDPEYQDVWQEGYNAFNANQKLESCGISPDSLDANEWIRGWLHAAAEDKEAKALAIKEARGEVEEEEGGTAEEVANERDAENVEREANAIAANSTPIAELDDDDFDL